MCWTAGFLEDLIIRLIILAAGIAIIRIVIPWLLSLIGPISAPIAQILYVVLWAIIAIWVVIICFGLLECSTGRGGFSLFPHYR